MNPGTSKISQHQISQWTFSGDTRNTLTCNYLARLMALLEKEDHTVITNSHSLTRNKYLRRIYKWYRSQYALITLNAWANMHLLMSTADSVTILEQYQISWMHTAPRTDVTIGPGGSELEQKYTGRGEQHNYQASIEHTGMWATTRKHTAYL